MNRVLEGILVEYQKALSVKIAHEHFVSSIALFQFF